MPTQIPSVSTFWAGELEALAPTLPGPTGRVAFWLQRDIVRGVFAPDERLKVEQLTRFYGIGHSPVREAILLLSSTGLVAHEHQKGYRVAPTSLADYVDVLDAYTSVYRLILAKAMERGDEAWEERVVVMLHRTQKVRKVMLDGAPEARERWQLAYQALHGELLSGAGSPVFFKIVGDLGNRLERYVNLYADLETDRHRDSHAEHRDIVDGLVARNREQTERLIDNYFARSQPMRESIMRRLEAAAALRPHRAPPRTRTTPKARQRGRRAA